MQDWAKKRGIEWALDKTKPVPSLTDIIKIAPEDGAPDHKGIRPEPSAASKQFPHLIKTIKPQNAKLQ
jgi:hypothetical protein